MVLAAFALAVPVVQAQAQPPEPVRHDIVALMEVDSIGGLSFSPDGKRLLFTSKRTGVANLYEMPLRPGAEPRALTASQETIRALGYFPDGERVLFSSDEGGNEITHIFVREQDGSIRDLTPGDRTKARFAGWSGDGASFFVTTNERDPRHFDLYEYSTADYGRRLMFVDEAAYQVRAISPDRRLVATSRIVDNANTDCHLHDLASGEARRLHPAGERIACVPQAFSPDGRHLFYTTDEGSDFQYLARMELASDARTAVLAPEWDVTGASISRDGRLLTVSINQDARTVLVLRDPVTLRLLGRHDAAPASISGFAASVDADAAVVVHSDGNQPGDVYLTSLAGGARQLLIDPVPAAIDRRDLVPGQVVRFSSWDGEVVPGVLYVPHGADRDRPGPAVIYIHGGPGGESRVGYKPLVQYLVSHGYTVYEINNRGSSGSGKRFYHLDDHRHGRDDLDDVVASKKMLERSGFVDPERIAVMGASYGGYLTLAALTFRPTEFAAGVNIYGVSNWVRLLQNTPVWWEDLRRLLKGEMGDWEADPDSFHAISPVFHAERIERPLLVLQGANDPRVLPVESEDIVARVRANGVPVEYLAFPDEGHSFQKTANQVVAYRTILQFLERHLAPAGGS